MTLVAVIGGTPKDTELGNEFLKNNNISTVSACISDNPDNQSLLQNSKEEITSQAIDTINALMKFNPCAIFIYCNSLSSAIDLKIVNEQCNIPIVTPLDVYQELFESYSAFGLITANERTFRFFAQEIQSLNPQASIEGFHSMDLVNDIEHNLPSKYIIDKYKIIDFCNTLHHNKSQVLILGCTHFHYLKHVLMDELERQNNELIIFEPSIYMYKLLMRKITNTL